MDSSFVQDNDIPDYAAMPRQKQEPSTPSIEMVFAKLKTLLRKADERSVDATWRRVGEILKAFGPHECAAYLRHAGYVSI
ncbi:hypothetical protein [Sinorhizobium meliloti]